MRDAAVGFQCPECVKEGAKQTRQGTATYGGARVLAAGRTTITLIAINVIVFVAIYATGGYGSSLYDALALLPQSAFDRSSGAVVTGVSGGAYWQLLTSQFAHAALFHVGANMLALYFLGPPIEQTLGRARFLAVYLGSGLVGSAAVMLFSADNAQTVGASGAIYGLFGAFVVVVHKVGGDLRQIGIWIVINLVITFSIPGISWQGHIGGIVGGLVISAAIVYAPAQRRALIQWSAITAVVVVALVAAVLRALALG